MALQDIADKNETGSDAADMPIVDRHSPVDPDESSPPAAASANAGETVETVACRPGNRFWFGVAVGGIVGFPLTWLLAYAATLPFFLGLFFFALFGLVIGAVVHRVASPGRPYARGTLLAGTMILIAGGWLVSIFVESGALPTDFARDAPDWTRSLEGKTRSQYVEQVADRIRSHLRENYAPGGTLGYVRWVVTSGEFPKGSIEGVDRTLRVSQRKAWWIARVLLSIGLFSFGIMTQTLVLRLPRDPAAVRLGEGSTD